MKYDVTLTKVSGQYWEATTTEGDTDGPVVTTTVEADSPGNAVAVLAHKLGWYNQGTD